MREGKYERELRELNCEFLKSIPRQLLEIKSRGRKVRSSKKRLRKAMARVEYAQRNCVHLPKPWQAYHSHGKYQDRYARPEVQEMHQALRLLDYAKGNLQRAVEAYQARYTERREFKNRLRCLPDLIETAKSLSEIEAKKKALKQAKTQPKDWKLKWQEVVPGLVVPAKTVKAYIKTFPGLVPLNEDTVQISNNVFMLRPTMNDRVYLKLPCHTWEQAESMSA